MAVERPQDVGGNTLKKIILIDDQGKLTQTSAPPQQSQSQDDSAFEIVKNANVNNSEVASYTENRWEIDKPEGDHANAEDYDFYYNKVHEQKIEEDGEFTTADLVQAYYFGENDITEGLTIDEETGFPKVTVQPWGSEKEGNQKEANDCLSRIMHNYGGVGLYNDNYNKMVKEICRINGIDDPNSIIEGMEVILPIPVFDEEGKNIIGFITPEENASGKELVDDPSADALDPAAIPDNVVNTLGLKIPEDESKITTNEDGSITYMDVNGVSEITLKLNEDGTYTQEIVSNKGTDKEVITNKKVAQDGTKLEELYTYADGSTKNGITGHKFKTGTSGNMTILDSNDEEVSQERYISDFANLLPQEVKDDINANAIINSDGSLTTASGVTYFKTADGFGITKADGTTTYHDADGQQITLATTEEPDAPDTLTNEEFIAQDPVQSAIKTAGFQLITFDTENAVDVETDGSKTFKAKDARGNEFAVNILVDEETGTVTITHDKNENGLVGEELHTLKYSEDGKLLREEMTSVNDNGQLEKVITVYNSNGTTEVTTETHEGIYLQVPNGETGKKVTINGKETYYDSNGKELNHAPTTYGNYELALPAVPGAQDLDSTPTDKTDDPVPASEDGKTNELTDSELEETKNNILNDLATKGVDAVLSEYGDILNTNDDLREDVLNNIRDSLNENLATASDDKYEKYEKYVNYLGGIPENISNLETRANDLYALAAEKGYGINDIPVDSDLFKEALSIYTELTTFNNAFAECEKILDEKNLNISSKEYESLIENGDFETDLMRNFLLEASQYGIEDARKAFDARIEMLELFKDNYLTTYTNMKKLAEENPVMEMMFGDTLYTCESMIRYPNGYNSISAENINEDGYIDTLKNDAKELYKDAFGIFDADSTSSMETVAEKMAETEWAKGQNINSETFLELFNAYNNLKDINMFSSKEHKNAKKEAEELITALMNGTAIDSSLNINTLIYNLNCYKK